MGSTPPASLPGFRARHREPGAMRGRRCVALLASEDLTPALPPLPSQVHRRETEVARLSRGSQSRGEPSRGGSSRPHVALGRTVHAVNRERPSPWGSLAGSVLGSAPATPCAGALVARHPPGVPSRHRRLESAIRIRGTHAALTARVATEVRMFVLPLRGFAERLVVFLLFIVAPPPRVGAASTCG